MYVSYVQDGRQQENTLQQIISPMRCSIRLHNLYISCKKEIHRTGTPQNQNQIIHTCRQQLAHTIPSICTMYANLPHKETSEETTRREGFSRVGSEFSSYHLPDRHVTVRHPDLFPTSI
jgi:hypothetical protein